MMNTKPEVKAFNDEEFLSGAKAGTSTTEAPEPKKKGRGKKSATYEALGYEKATYYLPEELLIAINFVAFVENKQKSEVVIDALYKALPKDALEEGKKRSVK